MSFDSIKFLGASVRGANASVSWNAGSPSQLQVRLVVDEAGGDVFTPTATCQPVYFNFGSWYFGGLLKKYERQADQGGFPVYQAICEDPREVLEGCQLILGGYSGQVGGVRNLLNVYGFYEAQAYGNSQSNDAGMPWGKVRDGVLALVNQPAMGAYGGPLAFKGHAYGLDLSEMPPAPSHYRVANHQANLLEVIAQVCQDAQHDFFVELRGMQIKVRTVSRRSAPSLTTLSALTSGLTGNTVRANYGLEGRNEPTSYFLSGGEVTVLNQSATSSSFWGHDADGAPIVGVSARLDLTNPDFTARLDEDYTAASALMVIRNWASPDGKWPQAPVYLKFGAEIIKVASMAGRLDNGDPICRVERGQFGTTAAAHPAGRQGVLCFYSTLTDHFDLNATPVADILGSVRYPCTEFELRLVKGSLEAWMNYVKSYRPAVAERIGLSGPFAAVPVGNARAKALPLAPDLVNKNRDDVRRMAEAAVLGDKAGRLVRFHEFVRGYAEEYLGRKFLTPLPFVLHKQDPETLLVTSSYEITDSGYQEEGSSPLGLNSSSEDLFRNPDGRFRCVVRYDSLAGADFSQISPQGTAVQGAALFVEAQADRNIVFAPTPHALVTVQAPLVDEAVDPVGDNDVVAALFQMQPEQARRVWRKAAFGNVGVKVQPAHRVPAAFGVPLKSNVLTYGPWYRLGSPGKTRLEQDPSLVPWNYGGYANMELAALAKVVDAVSDQQEVETGTLEVPGLPTASLGDTLSAGGPNVTNIQVGFDAQGVTTTYSFQTFTPKFGVFSRGNSERLRRQGLVASELRRSIRAADRGAAARANAVAAAGRANRAFMENAPKALKKQSPHDAIICNVALDSGPLLGVDPLFDPSGEARTRVGVAAATYEEAIAFTSPDSDDEFRASAMVSMGGLFRPFSTKGGGERLIPGLAAPASGFSSPLSSPQLNPFKSDNDIEYFLSGDTYSDVPDTGNVRSVGLRGPLVVVGWGRDYGGGWAPGSGYMINQSGWKAGPVDLLWDDRRGVWSSHDCAAGVAVSGIPAGGSGLCTVYRSGSATSWSVYGRNWSADAIAASSRVQLSYNAWDEQWYASAASGVSSFLSVAGTGSVPAGGNNTLFHTDSSGNQVWSGEPMTAGLWGRDYLKVGSGTSTYSLTSPAGLSARALRLPSATPAANDLVSVASWDGSTAALTFTAPSGAAALISPYLPQPSAVYQLDQYWGGGSLYYDASTVTFGPASVLNIDPLAVVNLGGPVVNPGGAPLAFRINNPANFNLNANLAFNVGLGLSLSFAGSGLVDVGAPMGLCGWLFWCHADDTFNTAVVDDWEVPNYGDLGSGQMLVRVDMTQDTDLTGMKAEDLSPGQVMAVTNVSAFDLTVRHGHAGSASGNRFSLPDGEDLFMRPGDGAVFWHDPEDDRWRDIADTCTKKLTPATLMGRNHLSSGPPELVSPSGSLEVNGLALRLKADPGGAHTLYHVAGSGQQAWSGRPRVSGVVMHELALLPATGVDQLAFSTPERTGGALRVSYPAGPPTQNQHLRVQTISGGVAQLEWSTIPGTGLTKTFDYVSDVSCSGSTLNVTKRTLVFTLGTLQSES